MTPREFDEHIDELATRAEEASARLRSRRSDRNGKRTRTAIILAVGGALIAAELVTMVVLRSMSKPPAAVTRTNPALATRFADANCRSARYRTYHGVIRYRREHGHPPDSLLDLVGPYLERVPVDPASGLELRYTRRGQGFSLTCPNPAGS